MSLKSQTNMKNLTLEQTKEIYLLVLASTNELLKSVEGVAKVAKSIQLFLGCEFSEAVRILNIVISEL